MEHNFNTTDLMGGLVKLFSFFYYCEWNFWHTLSAHSLCVSMSHQQQWGVALLELTLLTFTVRTKSSLFNQMWHTGLVTPRPHTGIVQSYIIVTVTTACPDLLSHVLLLSDLVKIKPSLQLKYPGCLAKFNQSGPKFDISAAGGFGCHDLD